jgi:hypothetical protein
MLPNPMKTGGGPAARKSPSAGLGRQLGDIGGHQ